MIEPLDLTHHRALTRLPESLHPPYVRSVTTACAQEHCAVIDSDGVSASLDCLEEELLGLGLAARALVSLSGPGPDLATLDTRKFS